jgi:hypothetical protein
VTVYLSLAVPAVYLKKEGEQINEEIGNRVRILKITGLFVVQNEETCLIINR